MSPPARTCVAAPGLAEHGLPVTQALQLRVQWQAPLPPAFAAAPGQSDQEHPVPHGLKQHVQLQPPPRRLQLQLKPSQRVQPSQQLLVSLTRSTQYPMACISARSCRPFQLKRMPCSTPGPRTLLARGSRSQRSCSSRLLCFQFSLKPSQQLMAWRTTDWHRLSSNFDNLHPRYRRLLLNQ